jgi:hypothetical protein
MKTPLPQRVGKIGAQFQKNRRIDRGKETHKRGFFFFRYSVTESKVLFPSPAPAIARNKTRNRFLPDWWANNKFKQEPGPD